MPYKNFNFSDDVIKKAVNEKVVAKHFKVKEIEIHRSVRGSFVRVMFSKNLLQEN